MQLLLYAALLAAAFLITVELVHALGLALQNLLGSDE